jgi:predicted Zn-dependent peptidase
MKLLKFGDCSVLYEYRPRGLATLRLVVNAGSSHEIEISQYGAAHFLEHMFFKGTKNKSYDEVNKILDRLGYSNAYTTFDKTVYHIDFLPSNFPKAFDPDGYFFTLSQENIWGDICHSIIGTKETVSDMTRDTLLEFKNKWYNPQNMLFVIVGDIQESEIEEQFTKLPQYSPGLVAGIPKATINYDAYYFQHKSDQAHLYFVAKGLGPQQKASKYVNKIFLQGFGNCGHSLMYNRLREELGLCYTTGCYENGFGGNYYTGFYIVLDKKNIPQAKEEVFHLLEQVKEEGFSQESLEISKERQLFHLAQIDQTNSSYAVLADSYFSHGIIGLQEYENCVKSIENEDIISYANWVDDDGVKLICMNGE